MADMPRILDCSVLDCSYNKEKSCGAVAITVGYSTSCTTFIPLTVKGGLAKAESFVGACQKADCAHNNALECTAASISVGAAPRTASPTRRAERTTHERGRGRDYPPRPRRMFCRGAPSVRRSSAPEAWGGDSGRAGRSR